MQRMLARVRSGVAAWSISYYIATIPSTPFVSYQSMVIDIPNPTGNHDPTVTLTGRTGSFCLVCRSRCLHGSCQTVQHSPRRAHPGAYPHTLHARAASKYTHARTQGRHPNTRTHAHKGGIQIHTRTHARLLYIRDTPHLKKTLYTDYEYSTAPHDAAPSS